ncbi:universal stress protein [Alteromonas sp. 1_MG-2023]|uniref:universal stress protein n=1 Tax=Alteromonas sp. 1_MG-2023 TaxID=3062669 RepID=UPI0026E36CE4|nr:universal stress protein [Alteromonas sp. 1_MG-2023]MDO6565862.1 universal stress protein [Alteromonas sp. 1_MG-2023]
MNNYKTILVPIDVFTDYEKILERAIKLAPDTDNVHLLYVAFPQTNVEPYGLFLERDYSQDVKQQAEDKLKQIAVENNIPADNVNVEIGSPADEIHHFAEKLDADLIVIGTHGQSGLRLLLGSTANAVLHGVKRDVLAVKI